ncbi:MAG: TerB family tellurite resistance protein [Deltaproteobacteria bacterium]|nr:MAG: TerB family tellurite resistance protein [Deltaproteobacteria bacterium]
MIDLVKRFFGKTPKGKGDQDEDPSHDIRIATCALLLEMASIDGEFSVAERKSIVARLKKDYQLSGAYAEELIKASNEELRGSVDLWRFTNLINRNYSIGEKIRIIETVWEIAYTDGKLDKYEDYLLHKLAKLLHLTHKQLIDAKLRVIRGETFPSSPPEGGKGGF